MSVDDNHPFSRSEQSQDLINICRSPFPCPVTSCGQMIGVTSVLTHFMRDHKQAFADDFQEIVAERRTLLMFNEHYFEREKTLCLGVLAYAGTSGGDSPAQTGMSRPNAFLPEKYYCFTNHLPILILGCKTHLSSLVEDKDLSKIIADKDELHDPRDDLLVIWLATMGITKPMHCTITAFSPDLKTSRSTIVQIRNLKHSQVPAAFLPRDNECLMLNRGEMLMLSGTEESTIELEIVIHEFEKRSQ